MNFSLAVFILILIGLTIIPIWFLRGALKNMAHAIAEHAKLWTRSYVKGACLLMIAGMASFGDSFASLTREQADLLPWWDWATLFFKPIAAMAATLAAFLDRSTPATK